MTQYSVRNAGKQGPPERFSQSRDRTRRFARGRKSRDIRVATRRRRKASSASDAGQRVGSDPVPVNHRRRRRASTSRGRAAGGAAAARVVEVIAGEGRAPVFQDPDRPLPSATIAAAVVGRRGGEQLRSRLRLRAASWATSLNHRCPSTRTWSSRRPFCSSQASSPPARRQAQVDALMLRQVLRRVRGSDELAK